jgi:hypothetical protein
MYLYHEKWHRDRELKNLVLSPRNIPLSKFSIQFHHILFYIFGLYRAQ